MAVHSTPRILFQDLANSMKEKFNISGIIIADNFPTVINNLPDWNGESEIYQYKWQKCNVADSWVQFPSRASTTSTYTYDMPTVKVSNTLPPLVTNNNDLYYDVSSWETMSLSDYFTQYESYTYSYYSTNNYILQFYEVTNLWVLPIGTKATITGYAYGIYATKQTERYQDVQSEDKNAYPINGTQDGFYYLRLDNNNVGFISYTYQIKTETGDVITNGITCPSHVTVSGQTSGISPGTYTAIYTPDTSYYWNGGSTTPVTVTLVIKAAS